jgi:tight adherence protein B
MPLLLNDPLGHKLIIGAFGAMLLGILWIRKVIRIQV